MFALGTVRCVCGLFFFFFQAEDGIRDLVRSRGLGDVYKRQPMGCVPTVLPSRMTVTRSAMAKISSRRWVIKMMPCLLYTSDAADDLLCVDLGGRRIIKKKTTQKTQNK